MLLEIHYFGSKIFPSRHKQIPHKKAGTPTIRKGTLHPSAGPIRPNIIYYCLYFKHKKKLNLYPKAIGHQLFLN